jgi:hypothetical protein
VAFSLLVTGVGTAVAVLWRGAVRERDTAEQARDRFEGQKTVAERLQGAADRARADLLRANYFRSIDLAWRAYRDGNPPGRANS